MRSGQSTSAAPKAYARIAGVLYLINIVFGFFAIGYVPALVTVNGDAAETAQHIMTHELLYRLGLVAHIIILLTNIPLAVIFYHLFKIVNRRVARMVVLFTLIGTATESVNLLNQFFPLLLLHEGRIPGAFTPDQLQSWSYMLLQLERTGFNLAVVFFGCYCLSIGYLLYKSQFFPKILGALMVIGGLCYLVNSFASFIAPSFAAGLVPYIQAPSGLAELSFCLWMLVAGLNVAKWNHRAGVS